MSNLNEYREDMKEKLENIDRKTCIVAGCSGFTNTLSDELCDYCYRTLIHGDIMSYSGFGFLNSLRKICLENEQENDRLNELNEEYETLKEAYEKSKEDYNRLREDYLALYKENDRIKERIEEEDYGFYIEKLDVQEKTMEKLEKELDDMENTIKILARMI